MRMDANEYLTDELVIEINKIDSDELITKNIKVLYQKAGSFVGKWIKNGGLSIKLSVLGKKPW